MFRIYPNAVLLLAVLLVQGCVTTGQMPPNPDEPNEALLQAAGNHAGLIELYKSQLIAAGTVQESDQYRYQLGQAYLAMSDPESTLFYIKPVIENNRGNGDVWLLQSRAQLAMDNISDALSAASTALDFSNDDPRIYNQLGLIYARNREYEQARTYFNKARTHMLNDITVKNNLAMIDILQEDYDSAIQRLMPLYNANLADDRVTANLVLALVRSQRYEEFKAVFSDAKTEQERIALFRVLSELEQAEPPVRGEGS